jgi:hypothetical protein
MGKEKNLSDFFFDLSGPPSSLSLPSDGGPHQPRRRLILMLVPVENDCACRMDVPSPAPRMGT